VSSIVEQAEEAKTAEKTQPVEKARVVVVGATGYAGRELAALLVRHPRARVIRLMSSGANGAQPLGVEQSGTAQNRVGAFPIEPWSLEALTTSGVDLAFLATPHEVSHEIAPQALARGIRVVDLSGAFRLKTQAAYPRWYGFEHEAPSILQESVYGLAELNGKAIRTARLVANPGCYATSVILALAPLLDAGVVDVEAGIVCDAKSGASGAGRSLRDELLFCSVNENSRAYGVFRHRHVPEILQALSLPEARFTFVPHLLPLSRGILSTLYLRLRDGLGDESLTRLFRDFYAHAPLIRLYPPGQLPEIQDVAHTPFADIGWVLEPDTRRLVMICALDNLGKGAASQAIQNMNLMLGWEEDEGLA
jgi:N-acetyl-gamma-glutamyl-phosphate reductase